MDAWIEICALDDIPQRGARVVQRDGAIPIALFRTAADRVFALIDRCPHRGGPLSQGLVTGERVVCPLHGWSIELAGGQAVAPDEGCANAYAIELRDGRVYLREADLHVASVVPLTPTLSPARVGEGDRALASACESALSPAPSPACQSPGLRSPAPSPPRDTGRSPAPSPVRGRGLG